MTLALYGKSRRRQGVLVLLALFAVMAALIGGVSVQQEHDAKALVAGSTEGTPTGNCANSNLAIGDNGNPASCSGTEALSVPVTLPAVPAHATDFAFQVAVNGQQAGSAGQSASGTVKLRSDSKNPTASILTFNSTTDSTVNFPGDGTATCGTWDQTWTTSDFTGLRVEIARTSGTANLDIDDVAVSVCYGGRTITAATVNTASSIVVTPSQGSINLAISTTTTGGETGLPAESNDWFCSKYQVEGQVLTTFNNSDEVNSGSTTKTAVITAPAAAGTYDITIFAYSDAGCTQRVSNTFTLVDALVVKADRSLKVQKVATSAANPGGTFDFTAASFTTNPSGLSSTVAPAVTLGSFSNTFTTALNDAGTITEAALTGWTDTRWALVNNNSGSATCGSVGAWSSADTSADVPADGNDYVVCFRNTPPSFVDLTVTKTASVGSVTAGTPFVWTIVITNAGNANATWVAPEIVLRDELPAGPTYSNITADDGDSSLDCTLESGALVCDVDTDGDDAYSLAAGASLTVTITATQNSATSLTNPSGLCKIDYNSAATDVDETDESNNDCGPSTVTVNVNNVCTVNNVDACIALLVPVPPTQTPPLGVCQGVNANFVIDISGSIGATNMGIVRSGIQSFASTMGASSKYAGTSFSSTATNITAGYVSQATFSTAVGTLTSGGRTWTEGGIAGARGNTANPLPGLPFAMFIVTDGSPNETTDASSLPIGDAMTWVNAANEAILQANAARSDGHWVRVVRAGPADGSIPFPGAGAQAFADAVLLRLAAGSAIETDFDDIASGLLESAGCNPSVIKSAGVPVDSPAGGPIEYIDWVVTLVNTSATAISGAVVSDPSAANLRSVTGGTCTPNTVGSTGPWTCTVPAKVGGTNGETKLTVRTTVGAYNICTGKAGLNSADVTGGIVGTSNLATYSIDAQPNDPSCFSSITAHKIEEGFLATHTPTTWPIGLSGSATPPNQNITDGGETTFGSLSNGTYTVTEIAGPGAVATCSPTVAAGSYTVSWSDTQNGTYTPGNARTGIAITAAGQQHQVWFKNTPCPPVVSIAKTNSTAGTNQVAAGGAMNWVVTVVVGVNPTTAPVSVADVLPTAPAGWTLNSVIASAQFGACVKSGNSLSGCTLPVGTAPGTYTITMAVTAPADFPRTNCVAYTNTATLSGGATGTATDTVTVTNCRDPKLALSKSSNEPSPLPGGGTFTWQVKAVVTDGPTVAAATIVDTLPAGFTFNGSPTFGVANGGTAGKLSCQAPAGQSVTCALAADAAAGDYLINIPVTAPAAVTLSICTTHTNQATASFPAGQGTVTGSPATDSVTITCPDVSVQKSRTSAVTVTPGTNNVTYSIVVSNAGPGTAHNIQVNDTLQAGVTWTASSAGAACVAGNTPMCVIASIPAGQSVTITVTGTTTSPASCGVINNTASIVGANDTTTGNNSSSAQPVTVECPDASVVKTLTSLASIDSGDTITYSITVAAGPNGASQNVVLTDVLEETMSWTVSGANLTGCNGPVFATGGTLTCNIGTLAANTSRTYTLTAATTAAVCGPVDNNATVSSTVDVNSNNNSSTAADVTVKCPNVVLQKTTSTPGPLNAGDPITYTITATNNGTGLAKDFFLIDNLPTSVSSWNISPANPNCIINVAQVRCPGAGTTTLAAGAQFSVTVTGITTPTSCGSVVNTAHAEASNDGASGITDAAAPAITVLCPDVTVLKDGNGPVNAGDQVIFTITVDNIGSGTAKTVALNDTLLTGQKWTLGGADAAACILTAQNVPQSLSCSWPTLTGAETAKVITLSHPTGTGSGLTCTPVQNTAGVTAANEGSPAASNLNSSTDSVSINCAEIKIVKVADTSPVSGTDNIGFKIKVWNTGAAPALGVQVTDTLPSNPGLNWSVDSGACTITSGVLTCNLGTLAANQSEATATVVHLTSPTTVATCGTVSNPVAQVTTTNDGSATDGENIVVNCPDVTVSKALYNTPNPVSAGDTIKFKIVVVVSGAPGTVAKNVTVNEQLPATTSRWSVESTTPSGICATLVSSLMCTLGNVTIPAGGAPVTFEIIITGDAIGGTGEVTCSGNITNTVTVAAGNESNTANNEATAPVAVNCPSVQLTKSANSDSVVAGDPLSFTLTVKNTGGGTAHSVVVEDNLPAGLTWSETDGACTIAAGKLVCNFADLLPGEANWKSVVVTATTSFAACSSLSNTAFISAGNDNLSGSQQTPSNEVNVDLLCSDVTITKAPQTGDEVLDLGETATFIITVNTATGGDAHDVEVTDTLPLKPGLVWSTTDSDCNVTAPAEGVAQVLSCTFAAIADGGSETVEVTSNAMTMDTCGQITNIASVVAGNEDPTKSGDNTSNEATVFVNCPDLEVLKTGADINNGEAPVFTITVKNKGVGVAKDVKVIDQLPPGTWITALVAPVPAGCSINVPGPGCTTLAPNETLTITITGEVTTTQCDPIENTASVTASNESDDVAIQANNISTATVNIACGTLQIVKIDHVASNNPNLSDAWHFTVDKGGQPFDTAEIALGGGSVSITKVPFGTYTVAEDEDQDIDTCPVPNPVSATFSTVVDDDTQELSAITPDATFTFTNEECGVVGSTGFLEIHKVSDINGNHVMDSGDTTLSGWPMTITGPEFPGGITINTDSQGRVLLAGIETGSYTVTEGTRTGYTTVGVVADDNAPVFSVANTATVDLAYSDTDIITFYNQPHGSIVVRKHAVSVHNGIESDSPADRDGWVMTVSSAACGVNQQAPTNASGTATFNNLPMCSDYVVSENPVNAGSPNFTVVGSPTRSPITPGLTVATEVTFTNERVTTDPPCPNCAQQPTPTPTQVPPTATTPATATPTNTTVPTNTVGPSTPTAVSTTAGERTPGPAQPTPVAPSTGEGIFGDTVGGTNLLLVLAGLAALAGGLAVVALGRRSGGR